MIIINFSEFNEIWVLLNDFWENCRVLEIIELFFKNKKISICNIFDTFQNCWPDRHLTFAQKMNFGSHQQIIKKKFVNHLCFVAHKKMRSQSFSLKNLYHDLQFRWRHQLEQKQILGHFPTVSPKICKLACFEEQSMQNLLSRLGKWMDNV